MMIKKSFDVCHNIFATAKPFSAQLYYFGSWSSIGFGGLNYLYGDDYCFSSRKCLKDLTKNEMYEICKTCAEKVAISILSTKLMINLIFRI